MVFCVIAQCENCDFTVQRTKEHLLSHVKARIPSKILSNETSLLPSRADLLDQEMVQQFKSQVAAKRPLLFMPNDYQEKNYWVDRVPHYAIHLFGILPCGTNTHVRITGIKPDLSVRVPAGQTYTECANQIKGRLAATQICFDSIGQVNLYPQSTFSRLQVPFVKIYFLSNDERKSAIKCLNAATIKVAGKDTKYEFSGDDSQYYPKVLRELRVKSADWNRIENYTIVTPNTTRCTYDIDVDFTGYTKLSNKRRKVLLEANNKLSAVIDRDPTIVAQWDIETHKEIETGKPPTPEDTDWQIFTICTNYNWQHANMPFYTVCTTSVDTDVPKNVDVTIVSVAKGSMLDAERQMLESHIEHLGRMMPNQLWAFNGGHFDWPLVREKCRRFSMLVNLKEKLSHTKTNRTGNYAETESGVLKWNFSKEKVKINAEVSHEMECIAKMPGVLDIDIMPIFKGIHPRAEVVFGQSLNFYLAKDKLPSKDDMPYKMMFRMFERAMALRTAPAACHCDGLVAVRDGDAVVGHTSVCTTCSVTIPQVDCIRSNDAKDYNDMTWSAELIPEIAGKCCHCGKRPKNMDDMRRVNKYCYIDCVRPQQLCAKRTVLGDKRETASQAYVPLFDAFYRANGSKVRNLIGKYSFLMGVAFSNGRIDKSDEQKDHYPGGWVFNPRRGLHKRRPISGLDFASLYPSLMMAYSLSPETTLDDPELAKALIAEGYTLHEIGPFNYERGAKKGGAENRPMVAHGWSVRHNGIVDARKDKITVERYEKNVNFETVSGVKRTISAADEQDYMAALNEPVKSRRVRYDPVPGRAALPGERMGLMAFVVNKLFNKRIPVKAEWVRWGTLREKMEKDHEEEVTVAGRVYTLDDVIFNFNKAENKQKAIKLLSNTFYGESGNFRSSVYKLLVAGGVTVAGQYNIKLVNGFVTSRGFDVYYGDTDSLYIAPPEECFAECDARHDQAMAEVRARFPGIREVAVPQSAAEAEFLKARGECRVVYWTEMVEIAFVQMNIIKEAVSDFLLENNGTIRLNMAYEEAGLPTLMCGKKKYAMIAHQETINFYPDSFFLRGLDFIKQGQTDLAKKYGLEYLKRSFSPENERDCFDVALDVIREIYATQHDISKFTLMGRFRPEKKNIPIHTFVKRMIETRARITDPIEASMYDSPEPGDKFKYVIVKRSLRYTLTGCKAKIGKGDRMEYLRVYLASQDGPDPLVVDVNHYMKNAIVGIFARFICYHEKFQPPANKYDLTDKEQYKAMDAECITIAGKFLEEFCDKLSGEDKAEIAQIGKKYKAIYKNTVKSAAYYLDTRFQGISDVMTNYSAEVGPNGLELSDFAEQVKVRALEAATTASHLYPLPVPEMLPISARRMYNYGVTAIGPHRLEYIRRTEAAIIRKHYRSLGQAMFLLHQYEKNLINMIEDQRVQKTEDMANLSDDDLRYLADFSEEEVESLRSVQRTYLELAALYKMRMTTNTLMAILEDNVAKVAVEPMTPKSLGPYNPKTVTPVDIDYDWL